MTALIKLRKYNRSTPHSQRFLNPTSLNRPHRNETFTFRLKVIFQLPQLQYRVRMRFQQIWQHKIPKSLEFTNQLRRAGSATLK